MKSLIFTGVAAVLFLAPMVLSGVSATGIARDSGDEDPHGHPAYGVLRVLTEPSTRGECSQCHPTHGDDAVFTANPKLLFTENSNALPFWQRGAMPCHSEQPVNYPLRDGDRLPELSEDPGYPEANDGGVRRVGVEYRGRWPGQQGYTNPAVVANGRYVSPHAMDADMPRQDAAGQGLCLNCHDAHGETGHHDLLVASYQGIGGASENGPPSAYRLCFSCHGADGPAGMELANRYIEDYYDPGLNHDTAGHRIRMNPDVALSWPSWIQQGDMMPCHACHNPHGSLGNNLAEPNAYLISDERNGWSGLTNTLTDASAARRFCFGCHIPADGIAGSQEVLGIVMNTLSEEQGHREMDGISCYDCHGRDYSSPTGYNVHHPAEEPGGF